MRTLLTMAALAVSVTALAKGESVSKPGAEPATLAQTFFRTDNATALAGVRRVAIPCFRVEFATEISFNAQSPRTLRSSTFKDDITLKVISDENRPAITDALCGEFVAALTAVGFELVPVDSLVADSQYQLPGSRLLASPQPVGTQLRKSLEAAVLCVTFPVHFAEQEKSAGVFRNEASVRTGITRQAAKSDAVTEPTAYAAGIQRYGMTLKRAMAHATHQAGP